MWREHMFCIFPEGQSQLDPWKEPSLHCNLWEDEPEERKAVLEELSDHMQTWQSEEHRNKLEEILERKPFLQRDDIRNLPLTLYSAGREHIGYKHQG